MAYKPYVSAARPSQPTDTPLHRRDGTRLRAGVHCVQIKSVEHHGQGVRLMLVDADGDWHSEVVWPYQRDGQQLSYRWKQLMAAVADDPGSFSSHCVGHPELLTGLVLEMELGRGQGYYIATTSAGMFEVRTSGRCPYDPPEPMTTYREALGWIKDRDAPMAYLRVNKFTLRGDYEDFNAERIHASLSRFDDSPDTDDSAES